MILDENIENDKLYEQMILAEKSAYDAQDFLLASVEKWFSGNFSEEKLEETKIILAQGGYIQIRTAHFIDSDKIEKLEESFNFKLQWSKEEHMIDLRNVDPVEVIVFEYSFLPKNMNKLLGDNQVDLGD